MFDASVVVDALVSVGSSGQAARRRLSDVEVLQVPTILGAEVTSALRRLIARGDITESRARSALHQMAVIRQWRYPFEPFQPRTWELKEVMTVYDAWYVALAEALGTELVTADRGLAAAPGTRCPITLLEG